MLRDDVSHSYPQRHFIGVFIVLPTTTCNYLYLFVGYFYPWNSTELLGLHIPLIRKVSSPKSLLYVYIYPWKSLVRSSKWMGYHIPTIRLRRRENYLMGYWYPYNSKIRPNWAIYFHGYLIHKIQKFLKLIIKVKIYFKNCWKRRDFQEISESGTSDCLF